MALTVDLPAEVVQRIEAEATRRGITVDELVAELTAALPGAGAGSSSPPKRLGFVGIGASGDTRPFDIHREHDELARRNLANDI